MKRINLVFTIVAIIIILGAISYMITSDITSPQSQDTSTSNLTTQSPTIPTVDAMSIQNATIPQSIATTNNAFAVDIFKELSGDKNIFFSPASIYVAFSLLYEGARESTAEQIQQTFGFEPDDTKRHNNTAHLLSSLNQDDPYATLDMANALWPANWFDVHDSYVDIGRKTYLADVTRVDFVDSTDSVDRINSWASDKTNEKITKVLGKDDVNGATALVITNAIYFYGTWITQFAVEDTTESDFWSNDTTSVKADFMHVEEIFDYTVSNDAQVLKMPYKGDRLSMLVILPTERDGIDSLEESLSADIIESWRQSLTPTQIIVDMPKFKTSTSYDLINPLVSLGIKDVFLPYVANLTGLGNSVENLFVSAVKHDAFVDVNEKGTEAAAVTTIIVTSVSEPPPTPRFVVDHPFLFIIQDDATGMILFMGKIYEPTIQS